MKGDFRKTSSGAGPPAANQCEGAYLEGGKGLSQQELADKAREQTGVSGQVVAIVNDFFGHTIDVAGLITGGDLIAQLKGRDLGARLLIPVNMLRHGGDVFLDDLHVSDVEKALGIPVTVVEQDGFDLLDAMLGRKQPERTLYVKQ